MVEVVKMRHTRQIGPFNDVTWYFGWGIYFVVGNYREMVILFLVVLIAGRVPANTSPDPGQWRPDISASPSIIILLFEFCGGAQFREFVGDPPTIATATVQKAQIGKRTKLFVVLNMVPLMRLERATCLLGVSSGVPANDPC